ncbi:Alpha/Beta hydrolase protein [Melanogaster broomeanus]|nr:Alpha/Beta hydrolase protein [Melanogaster broomeanus]
MEFPLPTTQWGSPSSKKRALLIHGLTSTSLSWYRVAKALEAHGYFVMAPDLLGHGTAPREGNYEMSALAAMLQPYVDSSIAPVSVIIGHSLGAPRLRPPTQNPASRQTVQEMENIISMVKHDINNASGITIEEEMSKNPLWTREDAAWKILGLTLCDLAGVDALFRSNFPWDFEDILRTLPAHVHATIVLADPKNNPAFLLESAMKYPVCPHRLSKEVTHSIHREFPEAIVDATLRSIAKLLL